MRIADVISDSIVDGPGLRLTVFTQGCPHHCPGCHNPQTHDFAAGEYADTGELLRRIAANPLLTGVTFSGGEPFCQPEALLPLADGIRAMGRDIFCYTGYTLEQLLELAGQRPAILALLRRIDTLVDGPYLEAQRDLTLRFRGSSNQRVIDLHEALPRLLAARGEKH